MPRSGDDGSVVLLRSIDSLIRNNLPKFRLLNVSNDGTGEAAHKWLSIGVRNNADIPKDDNSVV